MIKYVRQTAMAAGLVALSLASTASWAATASFEFKSFFDTSTSSPTDLKTLASPIATLTATDISGGVELTLKLNSTSLLPEKSGGLSIDALYLGGLPNGSLKLDSKDQYLDLFGLTSGYSSRSFSKDGLNYNWTVDFGGFSEGETAKLTIKGSGVNVGKLGSSPMLDIDNVGKPYATGFLGLNDNLHFVGTPVAGIPEPATYAMLGLGLAGIGFVARRRQQA